MLPSELSQKTQDVRDAAQRLIKQSQEAITRSDVLSERLEAHLFEQQQGRQAAIARRAAQEQVIVGDRESALAGAEVVSGTRRSGPRGRR